MPTNEIKTTCIKLVDKDLTINQQALSLKLTTWNSLMIVRQQACSRLAATVSRFCNSLGHLVVIYLFLYSDITDMRKFLHKK